MNDLLTNAPDTDYFFLGDGRLMAVIQWSRNPELSPYGILLYEPERMSRKNGSLLYHPELGISKTMLTVVVDGVRHTARHTDILTAWDFTNGPAVVVRWKAGEVEVIERFSVQANTSHLLRDVTISAPQPHKIQIEGALYANPLFFDEFGTRPGNVLYAAGYSSISFYAVPGGRTFERFLTVEAEPAPSGIAATFIYIIEAVGTHEFSLYPSELPPMAASAPAPVIELGRSFGAALTHSGNEGHAPSLAARIADTYRIARSSLRAVVSQLGKFDASIWQYDYEWGMDAAMVATAAASAGMFDVARRKAGIPNQYPELSNAHFRRVARNQMELGLG